jgi:hypothetical protein
LQQQVSWRDVIELIRAYEKPERNIPEYLPADEEFSVRYGEIVSVL